MKAISAVEAAKGSQGRIISGMGEILVDHVARDSREAREGSLFVAIIGENNDGHDYLINAYNNGCRVFMISNAETSSVIPPDATVIMVENTIKGLQELSRFYLNSFQIKRIGVTGSTGKTTTKEMLYAVFSQKYKTIRNTGNFNNHIGVPLTIFKIEEDIEAGIFEMGMNSPGEIDVLADIVRPQAAVITNIGISHLGNLGSRENILKAKLEITGYMGREDILIYNSDNDMLKAMVPLACRSMTVGTSGDADVVISNRIDLGEEGISFDLTAEGGTQAFRLLTPGAHNAWNAALAAACGLHFGINLELAAAGLAGLAPEGKRLEIKDANGIKIIDDTYNASPDSMKAAIDLLKSAKGKRKIAVLADMFELGDDEEKYHREVGKYAAECGIDLVISVGENAKYIADGARDGISKDNVLYFEDRPSLDEALKAIIKDGDVILLKGSRGMQMDQTVKQILEMRK